MAGREDYILRHIAMLRQLLAQALKLRTTGQPDAALRVVLQAQEKLFGRPAAEIAGLALHQQLELLAAGVSPDEARERQKGYALLLREAGLCFRARDRPDLATSAFKTALHIALQLLVTSERARSDTDAELLDFSRAVLAEIPPDQVDAPLRELLSAVDARPGS